MKTNFIIPMRLAQYLLICVPLWTGCLKPVADLYPEQEQQRPITVYVISLGWHVGIAFEARHLKERIPDHGQLPATEYLMVGWGDDKYYPAERPRADLFLRAALLPTGSVIHVVGFSGDVQDYFQSHGIVRVRLSRRGMQAMADHLAEQFARDEQGELIYAAPGLYRQSAFFRARGLYYFPKTSNRWAARVLRKSGFPITPFYALTAGNVMHQAGKAGAVVRPR